MYNKQIYPKAHLRFISNANTTSSVSSYHQKTLVYYTTNVPRFHILFQLVFVPLNLSLLYVFVY